MKLRSKWICVVWGATSVACSFDRTPVMHREFSEAERFWSSDLDGQNTARRSGTATRDQGSTMTPDKSKAQTGSKARGDTMHVDMQASASDSDAGMDDEDAGPAEPTPPPKPVACGDQFCPISEAPAATCCIAQTDIDQFSARTLNACGVNLSALDEAQYGKGCWQRDQLGIIDPRCPGHGSEPGCCADDGMCGSSNPGNHLGCYHAKGTELVPCRKDTEPVATVCDPRGSYALRVNVDAAWSGRPGGLGALTDDGRGLIQIYLLVRVDDVDSAGGLTTAARLCGVSLPTFYSSTLCEAYQATFPTSIWESPALPVPGVSGKYECAADGCVMSMWPTTYLFGIRLDNPEAAWPTPQQAPYLRCPDLPNGNCFADDDVDGQPGVSIDLATEGTAPLMGGTCREYPYRGAPLSDSIAAIFGGVHRADKLHVGIRARVGGSVRFGADCATASGSAVVDYVNSRANGCHVQPGTVDLVTNTGPAGPDEPCRNDEASFIDLSMPVYQVLGAGESPMLLRTPRDTSPSNGPTVSIVRFAPGTVPGCPDARAAAF